MIDKLFLEAAGKAVVRGATAVGKAVIDHFAKHWSTYLYGGGVAAVGGGAYAVGHSKGEKGGIAKQAACDEKKIKEMHQQHENDRKRWNEEKQAYEKLLDETENKL